VAKPFSETNHQFGIEIRVRRPLLPHQGRQLVAQGNKNLEFSVALKDPNFTLSQKGIISKYTQYIRTYSIIVLTLFRSVTVHLTSTNMVQKASECYRGDLYGWHSDATELTPLTALPITHFHLYSELSNMRLIRVNTKALYGVRRTAHKRTPTVQLDL
jgi:hypothetical protein